LPDLLHQPANPNGHGVVLTHGAGADCNSRLLIAVAEALSEAGFLVQRYNLPFRQHRPNGPPIPAHAAADREGLREAARSMRELVEGRIILGGHSYGGRQSSMLAAEDPSVADGLLLLSYPLHPPRRPDQLRTAHLPDLRTPSLFVHGTRDPFGSIEELTQAIKLIPVPVTLKQIESAGHDLAHGKFDVKGLIVQPLSLMTSPS
jgi:predicted alpha/beta-hydrolase family hydrolase